MTPDTKYAVISKFLFTSLSFIGFLGGKNIISGSAVSYALIIIETMVFVKGNTHSKHIPKRWPEPYQWPNKSKE